MRCVWIEKHYLQLVFQGAELHFAQPWRMRLHQLAQTHPLLFCQGGHRPCRAQLPAEHRLKDLHSTINSNPGSEIMVSLRI